MEDWNTERVLALAPDAASASAGQGLASVRKWSGLGASDRAVWGLCQGSGKDPYQARVDLSEPAFKCSCPSRKFPCKHGLGLLLLFAKERGSFADKNEPGWVSEWLESRAQKSEKKAEKVKAAADAPVDVEAQAKRAAARDERVRQGVAECRTWLHDIVRRGLAAFQPEAISACERLAARMVDAQAPGLASMVRRIPGVISARMGGEGSDAAGSSTGWDVRTLDALGRLHLLLVAADRLDALPADLACDVRVALGYPQSKEEVLSGPGVVDRWAVLGQVTGDEDRLTVRRTWLLGDNSQRVALVLDFAAGNQRLEASLVPGTAFEGEVAFYPSAAPLRGLVKGRGEVVPLAVPPGRAEAHTVDAQLESFARALGANPWMLRWPLVLPGASLARAGERWLVRQGGAVLPLSPAFERGEQLWRWLAATGGREGTIVAEWDGEWADPIGVFVPDAAMYLHLAPRWAA